MLSQIQLHHQHHRMLANVDLILLPSLVAYWQEWHSLYLSISWFCYFKGHDFVLMNSNFGNFLFIEVLKY